MKRHDYTGRRFGRLLVLRLDSVPRGHPKWLCRCDCGRETVVRRSNLQSGNTVSCGCFHSERLKEQNVTHGAKRNGTVTRAYDSWASMIQRCTNPNATGYKYWGGRGITVCERWKKFENFLADMGECPPGLTIERIDNEGNYEPGNVKWATRLEQNNNKRNTRKGPPCRITNPISTESTYSPST